MKISVLFYAHNQEEYVGTGLESILYQEIPDEDSLEVIVIDDGSTDGTYEVMEAWRNDVVSRNLPSTHIELIRRTPHENLGQSLTLKDGLRRCTGDFIAVLEGDDYWISKNHLAGLTEKLKEYPTFSAAFSSWLSLNDSQNIEDFRISSSDTRFMSHIQTFDQLLAFNAPGTLSACVYRTSMVRESMRLLEGADEVADWGLNLHMSIQGPLYWHPEVTLMYRFVENSLWRRLKPIERVLREAAVLESYKLSFPEDLVTIIDKRVEALRNSASVRHRTQLAFRHPYLTFRGLMRRLLPAKDRTSPR